MYTYLCAFLKVCRYPSFYVLLDFVFPATILMYARTRLENEIIGILQLFTYNQEVNGIIIR